MIARRASIPVLRFCVGAQRFGMAAEAVAAIVPARAHSVHIATVLGLESTARVHDRRDIHIMVSADTGTDHLTSSRIVELTIQADGPVDVVRLGPEHIVPQAAGIPPHYWKPIMGFARIGEQTILLLDIPSVIAALTDTRDGGHP
jgi:hypothetical protein